MKDIIKYKSYGYEWATEKDAASLFYCPESSAIGRSNTQFEIIAMRQSKSNTSI